MGRSMIETAAGICRVVEFNMADLIRQVTIQKGYDPRDFVLYAFGGAGPLHAAAFASALDIKKVIIPQRECASVWCAFGASAADILHVYEHAQIIPSPLWNPTNFKQIFDALSKQGQEQLSSDGDYPQSLSYAIDIRHKGQINEVEIPLDSTNLKEHKLDNLRTAFFDRYEELYGKGAAFRQADLEAVTFRCRAAATLKPPMKKKKMGSKKPINAAIRPNRQVWWATMNASLETAVLDGMKMQAGNLVVGPALIETPDTTVVVPPNYQLQVDEFGNFEVLKI